jgi:hypothetical protein
LTDFGVKFCQFKLIEVKKVVTGDYDGYNYDGTFLTERLKNEIYFVISFLLKQTLA